MGTLSVSHIFSFFVMFFFRLRKEHSSALQSSVWSAETCKPDWKPCHRSSRFIFYRHRPIYFTLEILASFQGTGSPDRHDKLSGSFLKLRSARIRSGIEKMVSPYHPCERLNAPLESEWFGIRSMRLMNVIHSSFPRTPGVSTHSGLHCRNRRQKPRSKLSLSVHHMMFSAFKISQECEFAQFRTIWVLAFSWM